MISFNITTENLKIGNSSDFHYYKGDYSKYNDCWIWITMKLNNEVIGIAKIGSDDRDKHLGVNFKSLWYLEISNPHQGKGYSKLLIDFMFKYLKSNNVSFTTSSYSDMGQERIYKQMNYYAQYHKVHFFDRDGKYTYDYVEKNYHLN